MKTMSPDTHPDIERILIDGIRKMAPGERFRRVGALNASLSRLARADILRRHPEATEREIGLRIASRRIPGHLMVKAFGWNPDTEGY